MSMIHPSSLQPRELGEMSGHTASEDSVCTLYCWILCSPTRFLFQVEYGIFFSLLFYCMIQVWLVRCHGRFTAV